MRERKGARSGAPPAREQIESHFGSLLASLVARVPGARAAALVDREGETVDYAGHLEAFSVRVAAAHLRIVLEQVGQRPFFAELASVAVRTTRSGFAVYALPEGYAIALLLSPRARMGSCLRAVSAIAGLLAEEGGWSRSRGALWHAVDVLCDEAGRPERIRARGHLHALDVLGHYESGLGWRERGWRVRFPSGIEAMLVRERGGHWYVDEAPWQEHAASAPEKNIPPKTLTPRPA
jgi:hypothetical protein